METRKQDFYIGLAFALGLVLLILPDTYFYEGPITSHRLWLNIASSFSDAVLFTTVFIFLKIEISKRRAINDQLVAANRLKSRFLQIAAHDLRNPLSTIVLAASQIPPENPDEKGRSFDPGEEIRVTADEMLGIINALLDTSAIEDGTFQLRRAPCDLRTCIGEVVERNRLMAKRKNQQLLFSSAEDCIADVDGSRIKQAVDNLVSNAIKFSPHGEAITVTLQCKGSSARIEVVDRGSGLTKADKERLFGQFQRLSAQPTGDESSTGLGLANARHLVELHGGKIGAESDGVGQGSRFWIELPTEASHPA